MPPPQSHDIDVIGQKVSTLANPITKNRRHFEDLAEGEVIALGPQTVTKPMILSFAREFDPLPFHLDEDAAKASLLGGLAASGWQTGGICLRLLVDRFLSKIASAGGLNFTNLKWTQPVMVNDTLSGTATIRELRRLKTRPHWASVTIDCIVYNQKGQSVMSLTLNNLVDVRDPNAPIIPPKNMPSKVTSEASK